MRVVLISTYDKIDCTGLRILAAVLRQAGFDTRMVFLANLERPMDPTPYNASDISEKAMQQVVDLCEDAGLVGVSVLTSTFHRARRVTEAIHAALPVPVVWGGVHATLRPEECLQFADLVCIGEGEQALVELARKVSEARDYSDVNNLALLDARRGLVRNPLYPLQLDLDALPFPDFELEEHYVLHDGNVEPCRSGLAHYYLCDLASWAEGPAYPLITARGCPYRCGYCVSHVMARIYPQWSRVRHRSPDNIIAEIRTARDRLPGITGVDILDDTFLAAPRPYLRTFSQLYQEVIGLPFRATTTPQTVDPEVLRHLVQAGLREICMGVQTGAPRILQLYDRCFSNEQVIRSAEVLNSLQRWIPRPRYQIITDSPFETNQDRFDTLRLIHRLPRPFRISVYALALLPETKVRDHAVAAGLLVGNDQSIYRHNFDNIQGNSYNLLLMLHGYGVPAPLLHLLTRRAVFNLLSHPVLNSICGWVVRQLLAWKLRLNRKRRQEYRMLWLGEHAAG